MMSRLLTAQPRPIHLLKARQYSLNLKNKTLIMGVINLTPDSFSKDGRLTKNNTLAQNLSFAKELVRQGSDILDLGAESSRPGAKTISAKEEIDRLIPTLKKLSKALKVPISVDTYKPEVAKAALEAGASIINTIKGVDLNPELLKLVHDYKAAIVLMHMRGDSKTMQRKAAYKNLFKEIIQELTPSLEKCLEMGIKKDRIIIDPGIGFAKNLDHNLEILKDLYKLQALGCPLLVGPSRKSFIGQILKKDTHERLMGTAAAVSLSIAAGANIVRVHDVAAIKDVVLVSDAIIHQP